MVAEWTTQCWKYLSWCNAWVLLCAGVPVVFFTGTLSEVQLFSNFHSLLPLTPRGSRLPCLFPEWQNRISGQAEAGGLGWWARGNSATLVAHPSLKRAVRHSSSFARDLIFTPVFQIPKRHGLWSHVSFLTQLSGARSVDFFSLSVFLSLTCFWRCVLRSQCFVYTTVLCVYIKIKGAAWMLAFKIIAKLPISLSSEWVASDLLISVWFLDGSHPPSVAKMHFIYTPLYGLITAFGTFETGKSKIFFFYVGVAVTSFHVAMISVWTWVVCLPVWCTCLFLFIWSRVLKKSHSF